MTEQESIASIQELLKQFRACPEAIEWATGNRSIQKMWEECPDPEWLLLSLKGLDYCEEAKLRSFAVACARRHATLFPNEKCSRILETAEAVAAGRGAQSHLQPAFDDGLAVANDSARLLDWSESRNAAICCVRDSVRQQPWDAARRALRNGQRASASAAREAQWQVSELRRILNPDLLILTERARELLAGISERDSSKRPEELRSEPGESPNGTVRQHFEIAGHCVDAIRHAPFQAVSPSAVEEWCHRCAANLDGLRIAGNAALDTGHSTMNDDPGVAAVVALLLAESESHPSNAPEQPVALLRHESPEVGQAAWWGLRLANARNVEFHLRALIGKPKWNFASAAALDILAFHRLPVEAEIGGLPDEEGDEIAWLLAEAGGRMRGAWKSTHLKQFLGHVSPRVREAALRASARCGLPELPAFCREATLNSSPLEAIEFLGVVGCQEDLSLLQRTVKSSTDPGTTKAALNGLGRLGFPAAVPFLLEFLSHPELADWAAAAIERITGQPVPRGTPPDPPPGLTEDELDLWEPMAPVNEPGARDWWKSNAARFNLSKRHQAGLNVSDAPLGSVFDQLPLAIRYDVYLRERALTPGTPDWELETWTWKQRNPGGNGPRPQG